MCAPGTPKLKRRSQDRQSETWRPVIAPKLAHRHQGEDGSADRWFHVVSGSGRAGWPMRDDVTKAFARVEMFWGANEVEFSRGVVNV